LRGQHHTVVEEVSNDGYMNTYRIESDHGELTAEGTAALRQRIREIDAIAQLSEVSRSDAFLKALADSATGPYEAAKKVIDEPIKTAKGLSGGVSRFVKRTSRKVHDAKDEGDELYHEHKQDRAAKKAAEAEEASAAETGEPPPEKSSSEKTEERSSEDGKNIAQKGGSKAAEYGKDWVGYTDSRRAWARDLGVDPYSDNEILDHELKRVSQAAAAGSLSMRMVPVPDVELLGYLGDANELVWQMDPLDLRMHNEKLLYEMGTTEQSVEALYDNVHQTPSSITVLVNALVALEGAADRPIWVDQALAARSRSEAQYLMRAANFLAAYHQQRSPLVRMVGGGHHVHGLNDAGDLILAVAMDRLYWTEDLSALVAQLLPAMQKETGAGRGEVWIEGTASPRATDALRDHGLEVHTSAFDGLDVTFGKP
jgi:hypothetical protein